MWARVLVQYTGREARGSLLSLIELATKSFALTPRRYRTVYVCVLYCKSACIHVLVCAARGRLDVRRLICTRVRTVQGVIQYIVLMLCSVCCQYSTRQSSVRVRVALSMTSLSWATYYVASYVGFMTWHPRCEYRAPRAQLRAHNPASPIGEE